MWGADKHKKMDIGKIGGKTTIVAQDAEINGDINFSGILQVDGRITGNIDAEQGLVRVSEHGRVHGVITAPNVLINGEVTGDVHANEHLELDAKARINGNLYYRFIEMVMGAQISGSLNHMNETASVTPIAQIADRTHQDE